MIFHLINLLPLVSSSKIDKRNQNNTSLLNSQSFNRSIDTMIVSNKLTRKLKSTLEGLDHKYNFTLLFIIKNIYLILN